ncbi:hypothetical protein T265_07212 [Opisthorchis viverrini]|uniref:Uncharacterized protein n=1 Tax=Opisthorchis viverrini TaxID=6198 RepID=A0A074ZDT6_OPIVI|nr:hypothetical protein T265_07212 [Opisthorchis viverrini]KER25338.1 hypothetical protein T265_07212 [Opisthorchis viverrini]
MAPGYPPTTRVRQSYNDPQKCKIAQCKENDEQSYRYSGLHEAHQADESEHLARPQGISWTGLQ